MSSEEERVAEILQRASKRDNVRSLPAREPEQGGGDGPPAIIGMTISPGLRDEIVNVLKKRPWEDVYKIMPELLAAQAIQKK